MQPKHYRQLERLHAHEITPEDAVYIASRKGTRYADAAILTLPSGIQIPGKEFNLFTWSYK